ncbi:major facilitator superfamily transporter [Fusarium acutatum]|uniref:Major facilitator superfamily transporter n=1 Tax=Fusarium acutatum TaxID=78861 RepID=A0A8H4K6B2_9HYPO|nr:major facilitator superfamily transporter [Fusarium acutatum]
MPGLFDGAKNDIIAMHVSNTGNENSETTETFEWTEAEEAAVRFKIDLRLVPLSIVLYLLCFLDRSSIGNARIQGMALDLDLVGYRFNWALSIFYIMYLLVEIPSNIILQKIGPKFYIPLLVVGFGLVSLCTAFVRSFAQLLVIRALLGVFEGGTMPGIAFLLSCFYKRHELMLRIGLFVSAVGLAGAFGGLLATVLSRIEPWGVSSLKIHTWRNIFFFEGLLTVLIGLLAPIFMPRSPGTASFLTQRERQIATLRLLRDQNESEQSKVTRRDVKRALSSIVNIICGLGFLLINIVVQGLAVFLPTILADLNWTATKAQLMTVPPNFLAFLVTISIAYLSDRTRKRGPFIILLTTVSTIGMVILRWETKAAVKYVGVNLVLCGAGASGPAYLSWAINNSAPSSVRAVTSAYIVTIGTLGGLIATWTYLARDAPDFHTGHTVNACGQIAAVVVTTFGTLYCRWENKARDAGRRDHRLTGLTEAEQADLGHDHPDFRLLA